MKLVFTTSLAFLLLISSQIAAPAQSQRTLSGAVTTARGETVAGATITVRCSAGELTATSDGEGNFKLNVPAEPLVVKITGKNLIPLERKIDARELAEQLRFEVRYSIPPIHDSLVISASQLDPVIDRRNEAVYRDTLFSRDDQVFHTLDAGINAGQHEGGGKSLEIRRFGFNLDHGGVNGGLKVLVDNVQQNQGTQGHGQGYLGQLKSLTPELVQDVDILNGPFSAEYGDFSGLGVVHIRLKESLPDQITARFQGGSFDTFRTFLAYSPKLKGGDALFAYEGSRTDGPFESPLKYKRDNVTGNYIHRLNENQQLGFKFNLGRNDFFSSGQIPLDEVFDGRLDRFGFIDPENGGRVRTGVLGAYYRHNLSDGSVFKVDGFLGRSMFDLWSNFTFFLTDETFGDEIQQHDSRLQEGINMQYLKPYKIAGQRAMLNVGANYHDNQINVGLFPSINRAPSRKFISQENQENPDVLLTSARARVANVAGYVQQGLDLFGGHLHLEGGIRYDYFRFNVDDRIDPAASGAQGASRAQPKFNLSLTPSERVPMTFYFNYGRGISSQDARGVAQRPDNPRISTTDFYQVGVSQNFNRMSMSADLFLIDRSNEQVYIPDDGSFEFKGPSRTYGFEVKTAVRMTRFLSFNAGVTKVTNAFFRDYFFEKDDPAPGERKYIDSAPHIVANAGLTLSGWHGFSGSLRWRHNSNYRLDPVDPGIRASGLDVLDLSVSKQVRRWIEFNFSIDNLADKRYFETQNFFESRVRPGDPVISRIHATPGYPLTVTGGVTFRFSRKD
ncbi:MAG TPA: TonB-dependent receptor [Blastocatellia bacterium]|nr:TonB-dependent receptor [Blastocatellia bacterium]